MKDMIYKRRSVRKYTGEPVEETALEEILRLCRQALPLYPQIAVKTAVVSREQVRFYLPWKSPQLIAVFSENKPGFRENVGFMLQQVELGLQAMGLGACWLGLGKFRKTELNPPEGMEFVIFIAFGKTEEPLYRQSPADFDRKPMEQITDHPDLRLECVRLAPSSTNSQPWYITHEDDTLHFFCSEAGLLRHKLLGGMNRIDMGIALAHLYVENPDGFRFFAAQPENVPAHYGYVGSVTLT